MLICCCSSSTPSVGNCNRGVPNCPLPSTLNVTISGGLSASLAFVSGSLWQGTATGNFSNCNAPGCASASNVPLYVGFACSQGGVVAGTLSVQWGAATASGPCPGSTVTPPNGVANTTYNQIMPMWTCPPTRSTVITQLINNTAGQIFSGFIGCPTPMVTNVTFTVSE